MRKTRLLLAAAAALTILAYATPALAQIVPGDYTITWVRQSWPGEGGQPTPPDPVVDAGSGTLRLEEAAGTGLCATPYVVASSPTTGGQFWCFYADGRLDPSNFGAGRWTQYSATVAVIEVDQGYRGTVAHESILAIAQLVPPPPSTAPQVFITNPDPGTTVRGTVWVTLWVEGTSGASNVFTLSADGRQIGSYTTAARGPVTFPWPTKFVGTAPVPNGTHTLTGTVRDAAGNTGTTSITIILKN
jgi:hypothetical protein